MISFFFQISARLDSSDCVAKVHRGAKDGFTVCKTFTRSEKLAVGILER